MTSIVYWLSILGVLGILTACSNKDTGERIASTKYYLVDWGKYHKFIIEENDPQKIIIPEAVIDYKVFNWGIAFVRQKIDSFDCDDGGIAVTISNELEVWVDLGGSGLRAYPLRKGEQDFSVELGIPLEEKANLNDFVIGASDKVLQVRSSKCH